MNKINSLLNYLFINNYLYALIVFIGSILAIIVVHYILYRILNRITKQTKNEYDNLVLLKLSRPALFIVISIFLILFSGWYNLGTSLNYLATKFSNIMLIISIAWTANQSIGLFKHFILGQYDFNKKDNLKARKVYTQMRIFERISLAIIIILASSAILMTFDGIKQIGVSLLASAGIAGIIIGFAAQKSIATILAGFQIAISQPIRLDDVVIVENEWGWIEEINLTYVVVRIWDKRRLIVPINYFIDQPFQNWTKNSADILGTIFIYADYTVPFDKLREELTRILENEGKELWDGEVNVLQVTDAKENTVEIRALVSSADSPTAWDLRVLIREKLIEYLQKNYPECLPRTRVEVNKLTGRQADKT